MLKNSEEAKKKHTQVLPEYHFFWLVLGTGRVTRGPAAASNHINFRRQVRRFVEVKMVIGRVEGVVASASRFTPPLYAGLAVHASHFWGERGDWVGLMAVWGKSESACCAAGSVGKGQGLEGGEEGGPEISGAARSTVVRGNWSKKKQV